jgi:transcription elongation factor GreA
MQNEDLTIIDAGRLYLDSLSPGERASNQPEVERFVRWLGADRKISRVHGQEVANYAETLGGTVTDASGRADVVRRFLAYAKKAGHAETNLGVHLRLRKTTASSRPATRQAIAKVEMTELQQVALTTELENLKGQRPRIIEDLRRAMADKDFRENAPLDAAKQEQALVEGRIRDIEHQLAHAVIVEQSVAQAGGAVDIGSTVVLQNLKSGAETTYTLVRPGEINAAQGKISYESPVGKALLARRAGDEVDVAVPSGTIRFRIERVEA